MKIIQVFIPELKTNLEFLFGTDKTDNFEIIDMVNENDIWFHINNAPSCHVVSNIYKNNEESNENPNEEKIILTKKILRKIVVQGACICKSQSKYKSNKNVEIVYTKIKDVKKTEIIGSVILENEKIIII